MKTRCMILIFLTLVLALLCFSAATAEEQLPAQIAEWFGTDAFSGTAITDCAKWDDGADGATWFVLIRTKNGTNVLYCFLLKDGALTKRFSTDAAVPQGKNRVDIYTTDSMTDLTTDRNYYGPILVISRQDEENEYTELFTAYMRAPSGRWELFRVWSYTDYDSMELGDGYITYHKDLEDSRVEGTAYGTFQRDLRYVSLSALPRTFKEAKQKLTEPPALPEGSELTAQEIKFTGGEKYAVYSAPDENALRGGNGKAKVSTNGWIQVFGRENRWILIQYSIDSAHYRFGYIDASSLPKKADVKDLDFSGLRAVMGVSASVTDDPLYSQSPLTAVSAGDPVIWLATMGGWAYIEGDGFRGFVPANALTFPASGKEGCEVYTGKDGKQYDLFEIRKLYYGADKKVYAVGGVYERIAEDDDCYYGETAEDGAFTYDLAPDAQIMMAAPDSMDPMDPNVQVTDLYAWYIDAYLGGEAPENGELTFLYDLPEEERETAEADFWFVTVRIRLNEEEQIEYMEYYYVPWA